jgi:hypothetical protein
MTGNLDVNGDLTKFGTTNGDGASYIYQETLNFGHAQAGSFSGWINYNGLGNGSTQFRNLIIGDGKQTAAATFTGSTKGLHVVGPLSTDGNFTALGNVALGNAGTDLIGCYGAAGVVQATGIGALTDNSGGAANDTLEAISAAYVQSEVRNNFADLAAKVNAIRTVLLNLGLLTA